MIHKILLLLELKFGWLVEIPSIVVDSLPETPPQTSRDITGASFDISSPEKRFSTPDVSFALDGSKLQRSSRRNSDFSMFSSDINYKTPYVLLYAYSLDGMLRLCLRRTSMIEEDPNDVVLAMQNSAWGGPSVFHS